jgi:hypothetical protein
MGADWCHVTTAASPEPPSYKYWAFISYSHRDESWARWLHTALETYRIPAQLAQRHAITGLSGDRIYPVFRDRDELSGGFDLAEAIKDALEQSRFLIVICSPSSAASGHVRQEIEVFEGFGREDRVICLIVDGEPGASARPESGLQECLPAPVRTKKTADGVLVPCEPIAADVRKGKDGKTNAKLKILAEMLGVAFNDLKQRDERRHFKRRMQFAAAGVGAFLLATAGFLLALDAGVNAPGGATVRRLADRHHVSILRRFASDAEVRQHASQLRKRLAERLLTARRGGWFGPAFKPDDGANDGVWIHSQIAYAMLSVPDGDPAIVANVASMLGVPFSSDLKFERNGVKYGWLARPGELTPLSVPAFWTAMSLATALRKDGYPTPAAKSEALDHLAYVQEALASYHPAGTESWNLFPRQRAPAQHNVYAATLALMSLLEAKRANLPWRGTTDERDRLIRQTFDWLVARYDRRQTPPGWKPGDDSLDTASEGLSLQIYGRLLDAQATAGLTIPTEILRQIPRHLAGIVDRPLDFPSTSGEFVSTIAFDGDKPYVARESINFPWYPWALDCAVRWLESPDGRAAPPEDRVVVERALAHLVMTLGDEAATSASDGWTFVAAEMVYGLSTVAPTERR